MFELVKRFSEQPHLKDYLLALASLTGRGALLSEGVVLPF
jgi:hypothetical protein